MATEKLGERIGQNLKGGEAIELVSDLGGGKTTLVRGIAKGAGSTDRVASPTFTVNKEYQAKNFRIVHYDFYRLQDAGIMAHELAESLEDPKKVTVVEWADIVQDILPANKITINIRSTGDDSRRLDISSTSATGYVLEGIE